MVSTNIFNPRNEIPRMNELNTMLVRRGARLGGGNSTILYGITLGRYAWIGAGGRRQKMYRIMRLW